ncbi:thiamine pyrophosphate-binding protein [Microbacterium invictum]|uniref:Thiamine pyrophosphate-binding protein n=1 Tax=Microbacterium invictum TaxID=515415 RepID=A0ABZ0VEA6_9MICO|nr:thiamine pyrophosphate-binding protein [Microbacterium invictum]WQB70470.1 thiamine pyrophosphate-binding protein [Microbacterium invictum]
MTTVQPHRPRARSTGARPADAVGRVVAASALEFSAHAFGVMGADNAVMIDGMIRLGMSYSPLRHEAGAITAADAYTRMSDRPAVCTTTSGPGFTNALTALTEASRARSPLVLLTGSAPLGGARSGDIDIRRAAALAGARAWLVEEEDTVGTVRAAFRTARAESRPAVLCVPADVSRRTVTRPGARARSAESSEGPSPVLAAPTRDELARLADRLRAARRPLLLAGRGALGATEAVRRTAAAYGARTATTTLALGAFGSGDAHLGIAGGFATEDEAAAVRRADVVLVVGASLNRHTTRRGSVFAPEAHVAQIDVAPQPTSTRVDQFVTADAEDALVELLLQSSSGARRADRWRGVGVVRSQTPAPMLADGLHPAAVADAVADAVPSDAVFVVDGGNFMAWPLASWRPRRPRSFVPAGLAFQSIGLGLGAFVGAAAARRDAYPVLGVGDGGLLMSLADLDSAARLVPRGAIVVFNDAAYGAEVHQFGSEGFAESPMRFPARDFALVAGAFGLRTLAVYDRETLRIAASFLRAHRDELVLLDCRISPSVAAPFLRALEPRQA